MISVDSFLFQWLWIILFSKKIIFFCTFPFFAFFFYYLLPCLITQRLHILLYIYIYIYKYIYIYIYIFKDGASIFYLFCYGIFYGFTAFLIRLPAKFNRTIVFRLNLSFVFVDVRHILDNGSSQILHDLNYEWKITYIKVSIDI